MNDNQIIPNPNLRQHATDHAFIVTMRRSHISVLTAIAHGDRSLAVGKAGSLWVPAARQLGDRGLVEHRYSPDWNGNIGSHDENINAYYRLTKAGWHMHGLLLEAGMVMEVTKKRKLVAA